MNSASENQTVTDAVILAAGLGSRLGDMTQALPKCMVEVGGHSMLSRALETLEKIGVRRVVIVTGYLHETLETHARSVGRSLELEFVHSKDYATTNNIYSLWLANESIKNDFFLVESDLLFDSSLLTDLRGPSSAAVSPLNEFMDGTVLTSDADGVVEDFYLKNDSRPDKPLLKTINLYRFSFTDWRNILAPRFKKKIDAGELNVYYELVFAEAVRSGDFDLNADVFSPELWREVDTPEDYLRAQQLF